VADVVLDSSAILADVHGEAGAEETRAAIAGACISAVNYAEVITKLIELGASATEAKFTAETLAYKVVEVDQARAASAGMMHERTRRTGVSLGDRFCLALGEELRLPVLTADRRWKDLGLDVEIRLIR
jgi:ribonuclease VapC